MAGSISLGGNSELPTRGFPDAGESASFSALMTVYIALLRAVNVGGTGKLPMTELKKLCEEAGFTSVKTYIASGNVLFKSDKSEAQVKAALEKKLHAYAGKPVGVMVRTAAEMSKVLEKNAFPDLPGNRTVAIFLDEKPAAKSLEGITGQAEEKVALGKREFYVYYGEGMAHTKLKIPGTKDGTARNMNTVAKLIELAEAL